MFGGRHHHHHHRGGGMGGLARVSAAAAAQALLWARLGVSYTPAFAALVASNCAASPRNRDAYCRRKRALRFPLSS